MSPLNSSVTADGADAIKVSTGHAPILPVGRVADKPARPSLDGHQISANTAIDAEVKRLWALGCVPLPVAPAFPAEQYPLKRNGEVVRDKDGNIKPLFCGKNPSWVDSKGIPKTVKWRGYATREPSIKQLQQWFKNPDVGLGHIPHKGPATLDFDLTHISEYQLNYALKAFRDAGARIVRTPSGGAHVEVDLSANPDYTKFGIGSLDKVGELLHGTAFVVDAPTEGYTVEQEGEPLRIDNPADFGIRKAFGQKEKKNPPLTSISGGLDTPFAQDSRNFDLSSLLSKKVQALISESDPQDRSDSITKIAKEVWGWENVIKSQGHTCDSADALLEGIAIDWGLDKLDRCLAKLTRESCQPALAYAKGIDACIDRLKAPVKRSSLTSNPVWLDDEDTPGTVAFRELYARGYVRIRDNFYRWTGQYYKLADEATECNRIAKLLNRCVLELKKDGEVVGEKLPFRNDNNIKNAYGWCLKSVRPILPDDVNPPGVNLTNGVLVLDHSGDIPQPKLLPHSPFRVYTYEPLIAYDPDQSSDALNLLLAAIEPEYQDAVLKVFAASLDLGEVRKRKGRCVRTLLLNGDGNNGKDSLRSALSYIYGKHGVTGCTISDHGAYDQGKRFNLAPLSNSRVNWASENKAGASIDNIQSLKQVNTGDPLVCEEKHVQGVQFTPRCISIFSFNAQAGINLTATQEATRSRYAIVPFKKTFKDNPTEPGEIKADSRFAYDQEWVKREVCPAFLNLLIEKYQAIFTEGIDYSAFDEAMDENRIEANHLLQFAADCGLEKDTGAWLPTSDVWRHLSKWYIDEEHAYENEKGRVNLHHCRADFQDDMRPGDPWVKGSSHVARRLKKVFPHIVTSGQGTKRNNVRGIIGLRFVSDCERALRGCDSWESYSKIAEFYGKHDVDEAWANLSPEKQNEILSFAPAEAEPTPEDKPLSDEEIADNVAILETTCDEYDHGALSHFENLSELHKGQIWSKCSTELKDRVKALKEQGPAPVPMWQADPVIASDLSHMEDF